MKNLKLVFLILFTIFCVGNIFARQQVSECKNYGAKDFVAKKISLNFEDTELHKILVGVTKQIGCEFVVDKSVGKPIFSIKLDNVPWDEAIKSLISLENLSIEQKGPVFRVANIDVLKSEDNFNLPACSRPQEVNSNSIQTEIIILRSNLYPSSMKKEELGKLISSQLSKKGLYEIDDNSNALKITDLKANRIAVIKLITKLYIKIVAEDFTENQKKP
jgi:type IV pilus assembly protein PilQ